MKFGLIISIFPKSLRPCVLSSISLPPCHSDTSSIVSCALSDLPSQIRQQIEFIRPTVDPQNDMPLWLMSEAKGVERSLEGVAR